MEKDEKPTRQPKAEPKIDPAPLLRLVDEHGELHDQCPGCVELERQVKMLETEKRSWHQKYLKAVEDRNEKARGNELWGKAIGIFNEWRIATGHMKSRWNADRFFLVEPYLKADGYLMCRAAVWGIAAHPNTKQITPAFTEVYDSFELVFRNREKFERYANRGHAIFGKDLPEAEA